MYDPRNPDDRLVLGMKGTMSEMELSLLRRRLVDARRAKARRGELFGLVAIGYLKTGDNRIEKDPNRRVRDAIGVVFSKFAELQSARQVLLWLRQERVLLPVAVRKFGKQSVEWKAPAYRTIYHILTNPVYAGAYAFGRQKAIVKIENGRKRVTIRKLRNWRDWDVLIKEHHEGYITWEDFESNRRLMADNANRMSKMTRGSIRHGEALLVGLLRCARCARKLRVSYSGSALLRRYVCRDQSEASTDKACISFGGLRVDRAVAQEVLEQLRPLGIEAAMAAMHDHGQEHLGKGRQLANALEQARFEAARAHRQYDEADPGYRLVAAELERRWNEKLIKVRELEERIAEHETTPNVTLCRTDRDRFLSLGQDLPTAWYSVGASAETRKKIIRLLIEEIIVDVVDDKIELVIHWQGGDHMRLSVKKNKSGHNRLTTDADVVEFVRVLARHMPDNTIASILNRSGKSTGHGNSWTSSRVYSLQYNHKIAPYREGERAERGEVTLDEAAALLSVSSSTILRMLDDGTLPGQQFCKGAPWIIRLQDLERKDVRDDANRRRLRRPPSRDADQKIFDL